MDINKKENIKNNSQDIILLKDREWNMIDGIPCKIIDFSPLLHSVKNGKVLNQGKELQAPYASIIIECKKIQGQKIKGFITNKIDFIHLWEAFKERTVKQDEEVIIFWSKKHYKLKLLRFFPGFWPKLWVMICQEGAFELMTNPNHKPELKGEARYMIEKPIVEWKPEIMK